MLQLRLVQLRFEPSILFMTIHSYLLILGFAGSDVRLAAVEAHRESWGREMGSFLGGDEIGTEMSVSPAAESGTVKKGLWVIGKKLRALQSCSLTLPSNYNRTNSRPTRSNRQGGTWDTVTATVPLQSLSKYPRWRPICIEG